MASSELRFVTPVPRSTASVSGGRATPMTIVSVGSRVSCGSSVGHGSSGEAISPPVFGGREAAIPEWTAKGSTEIVEGQTVGDGKKLRLLRGDFSQVHTVEALHTYVPTLAVLNY